MCRKYVHKYWAIRLVSQNHPPATNAIQHIEQKLVHPYSTKYKV